MITAVVLGGTSIFGGRGTIVGTVLGLMLIQALKNGLSLTGVKGDGTIVVIGTVLILSILITNLFAPATEATAEKLRTDAPGGLEPDAQHGRKRPC